MGFRKRAGSAVEGFGILESPLPQEGLRDSEPPFPQGRPQDPRAPGRTARRSHASREGRTLQPLKMAFGLGAESAVEGSGIRVPPFPEGGLRDSRASAPSRRPTGTSCPPPGESEGVMLPEKGASCRSYQVGFRLRAGSAVEGFGILMPSFPHGGLPDSEPPFPQGGPQEPRAPGGRARRSHASREARTLQPLKMAFGLWAESTVEGIGIRVPPFA